MTATMDYMDADSSKGSHALAHNIKFYSVQRFLGLGQLVNEMWLAFKNLANPFII